MTNQNLCTISYKKNNFETFKNYQKTIPHTPSTFEPSPNKKGFYFRFLDDEIQKDQGNVKYA